MLRRTIAGGLLVSVWLSAWAAAPHAVARAAEIVISVNKATQTMVVLIDGAEAYNWTISTGVGGGPYDGTYKPGRMERKWASRKYGMAPMPYSIFFDGDYAIHGTVKISQLGRRASKGCVRLHPRDAAVLFELVGREKANTTIVVDKTTHVAARNNGPVASDAPPPEAKAAPEKSAAVVVETTQPELAKAQAIAIDEPVSVRKRSSRKSSSRKAWRPLPYGMTYGSAQ
jgi:hypothetical protein